jgi:hypothetical protein
MFYEIKTEPDQLIYMSACLLLEPFQQYLEVSVFGLSICKATANNSTVGNDNVFLGFCLAGGGVLIRN